MTRAQWKERMELLEASCISQNFCLCVSKQTGCWVFIAFGLGDVGVRTGTREEVSPELPSVAVVLYRWGTKTELADKLGISGIADSAPIEVFADAILDQVIHGTWDRSRDSKGHI